ncbi:hypothetical protein KSF_103700 [Reticulibacter mediterranei]|uniref:Cation-transporting P-type ATPase N-terminal domain-containing protein n=1 Tax=Reticulibacter mediterranei TaxID=2778369 RepID=A0A8J3NAF4_9CHLR|nr:hypothetical protein KSF_103700 [Reticulibacter mediterranei]
MKRRPALLQFLQMFTNPLVAILLIASFIGSVAKNYKLIKMMTTMKAGIDIIEEKERSFYMFYRQKFLKYPSF